MQIGFTVRYVARTRLVLVATLIPLFSVLAVSVASASPRSATGRHGEVLTVSKVNGLKPNGAKIIVIGNKFDETVGIYVAFCVLPKKRVLPSPCGGGVDESGATGASKWISSNPPPYGQGLAMPFKPGGRFKVAIKVNAKIGKIDCRKVRCGIVVRADHTRGDDRTHDVFVPVSFQGSSIKK